MIYSRLQAKQEKIIKENLTNILQLCDGGFPLSHIAKKFGVSVWRIKRIICNFGRETREQRIKRIRENELTKLIRLYFESCSIEDISKEFSISANAVRKTLLDSNVKIRRRSEIREKKTSEKIFPLLDQNLSYREIQRKTGCCSKTIRRVAIEAGKQVRKTPKEIEEISKKNEAKILLLYERSGVETTLESIKKETNLDIWHIRKILEKNQKERKKRKYFQNIHLFQEEEAVIVGGLLGDASISSQNAKTARVSWNYSVKPYAKFVFEKVKRLCNCIDPKERAFWECSVCKKGFVKRVEFCPHCGKKMGRRKIWTFQTKSLRSLKEIDNCVRKETSGGKFKKTISKDWLKKLTPLSLAIWYADDGSLNRGTSIWFYTCCFNYLEHRILQDYFSEIWQINTHIRKGNGYFRLRVDMDSNEKFVRLIKMVFPICMKYKLPNRLNPLICDCCGNQFVVPRKKYKHNLNCCSDPQCRKLKRRFSAYKSKNIVPLDFESWIRKTEREEDENADLAIK